MERAFEELKKILEQYKIRKIYVHPSAYNIGNYKEFKEKISKEFRGGIKWEELKLGMNKQPEMKIKRETKGNHAILYYIPPNIHQIKTPQIMENYINSYLNPNYHHIIINEEKEGNPKIIHVSPLKWGERLFRAFLR